MKNNNKQKQYVLGLKFPCAFEQLDQMLYFIDIGTIEIGITETEIIDQLELFLIATDEIQ